MALPRVQTPIAASIPSAPFESGRDIGESFYGMGMDDHHDLLGAALRPAWVAWLSGRACDQYGFAKHMADSPQAVALH